MVNYQENVSRFSPSPVFLQLLFIFIESSETSVLPMKTIVVVARKLCSFEESKVRMVTILTKQRLSLVCTGSTSKV